MKQNSRKTLIAILLFIWVSSLCASQIWAAKGEISSIQAANSAINQAFRNVLSAEKAGANCTQILASLNNAGELLAEADNANQIGDTATANSKANNAAQVANEVNSQAIALQKSAANQSRNNLLLTAVFSVSASLIYAVILLFAWRNIKSKYNKKLLSMKPKVVKNEP